MRPTDTTNLRNRIAASRAAVGYNDRQFVDVPIGDLEALLTELDGLRGPKTAVVPGSELDAGFWGRAAAKLVTERDSLKQENLELRSRTVFPKAALTAKLAEAARTFTAYLSSRFPKVALADEQIEISASDGGALGAFLNALHAYEKEDAEYPLIPAECDVRRIMIDIVPGPDGEGVEVYARNVEEVEKELAKLSEEMDERESALVKCGKFKTFVHGFLDKAGVPVDPDAEHTVQNGCRISGRLSWLVAHMVDAQRWRGLLGSQRIRMMGSAGLAPGSRVAKDNQGYAHFGMEIWTMYRTTTPGEFDQSNANGRDWLTKYADIARAAGLGQTP